MKNKKPPVSCTACDACGHTSDCLELTLKNGLAPIDICIDCARIIYNTLQENT